MTTTTAQHSRYFLLVFSRPSGVLMRFQEFASPAEAVRERFAVEYEHRGESSTEVIVIGADTVAALKVNHARYFCGIIGGDTLAAIEEAQRGDPDDS